MADFKKAYNITALNEGGYANKLNDRGGETWEGIARKIHPDWKGWPVVDAYKTDSRFPAILRSDKTLQSFVEGFYKSQFWNIIRGDEISFQEIANQIYDDAVNTGTSSAIKKAQNVTFGLPDDDKDKNYMIKQLGIAYGRMDEKTLNKINLSV